MRSPAKLYEPTRRVKVYVWLFRALDFVFRGDIAHTYRQGPWCPACRRWWPDGQPGRRGLLCKCGVMDPVVQARLEAEAGLPRGSLGGDLTLLLVGLLGAALLSKPRVPWWAALGLEGRPESLDDARRAYRNALVRSHPDQGGSMEQMQKVRKAWLKAERDYGRSA